MAIQRVATLVTAGVLGAALSASALPINMSFELGTTGWTVTPNGGVVQVVGSHNGDQGVTYLPQHGSSFALVLTGNAGTEGATLRQDFTVNDGDIVAGAAAFDARDYLPFDDFAWVRIYDSEGAQFLEPWTSSVSLVGDYGDGPWTRWEWTVGAGEGGSYTLEYGIINVGDSAFDSYATFDAVPEPGTLLLLGSGLTGLAMRRRRKI